MSIFGAIAGLFTASKIHDSIDKYPNDGFLEDSVEVEVSSIGGSIVGGVLDTLLGSDDDDDHDDDDY